MATTIHFPHPTEDTPINSGVVLQYAPEVFIRQKWGDTWLPYPKLAPVEVTWSVAPTLPVATFEMDYGSVRPPYRELDGDGNEILGFQEVTKWSATNLVGWFVRIKCLTNVSESQPIQFARYWYGVVEQAHDEQGGTELVKKLNDDGTTSTIVRAYGRVTLVAYGLEKLLADHQVLTSWCEGLTEVGISLDFNRAGPKGVEGNRSPNPFLLTYLFGKDPVTAKKWSTRQIVEYLLAYHVPQDQAGDPKLHWYLDTASKPFVCDTDNPLLKCENASTYSLISQLLDRRRGLMWWVEVDQSIDVESNSPNAPLWIKCNSINSGIVVGSKISIPANTNQINIEYDSDPLTKAVINTSDLQRYDQVVVRGPRIRCVGTFSAQDGTLEAGWKSADESTYEAGGTPHPAGIPRLRKEERNDKVRRSPKLSKVFSLFRIPSSWDFLIGDGEGGVKKPMFCGSDGEEREQNYLDLAVEQTMPILEGNDYSGTFIPAGTVPFETVNEHEMRPLVFFRRPKWTTAPYKYQPAEGTNAEREVISPGENAKIQCHVSVPQNTMTIRLEVAGEKQHAIAYGAPPTPPALPEAWTFQPIAGEDKACGQVDWRKMVVTLSIESQFHIEAIHPDPALANDTIRKKIIYAGDQYYQHYVAPNTVVGIDTVGFLIRSDGGWIPTTGAPEDPIPYLKDVAKVSAAWYTVQHFEMTLQSYRLKSQNDIPLGALILKAGGGVAAAEYGMDRLDVNAPVTQITFRYPAGNGTRTPAATMEIKTWAGELEAVELVPVKLPPRKVLAPGARHASGGRV